MWRLQVSRHYLAFWHESKRNTWTQYSDWENQKTRAFTCHVLVLTYPCIHTRNSIYCSPKVNTWILKNIVIQKLSKHNIHVNIYVLSLVIRGNENAFNKIVVDRGVEAMLLRYRYRCRATMTHGTRRPPLGRVTNTPPSMPCLPLPWQLRPYRPMMSL